MFYDQPAFTLRNHPRRSKIIHQKVDTTGSKDSQGTIDPEQHANSRLQPVSRFTQPVLGDVDEYCAERYNARRHEQRFGRVQEGCFERFWEEVETKRDQDNGQDEQRDIEQENGYPNGIEASKTEGH